MASPKIVLTADRTLMSSYRGLSLATFFGCAPALDPNRSKSSFWYKILGNQVTPKILFDFICNYAPHTNGIAKFAPYGLRKVEAGLLRDGFKREDVVVAHPDHIEKFIGPETEVVGTHEMDPLGMGPVTMTFTYGRRNMSYDEFYCRELHRRINAAKKKNGSHAKVIAGASGTWQYNYAPEKIEEYGLYAILEGELGGIAPEIDGHAGNFFNYLIDGQFENMDPFRKRKDFKVDIKEFKRGNKTLHGRFVNFWDRPELDDIPEIVEPSMHGMIEVMRGCGRGCKFCDVTLRSLRYYSPEKVKKEIQVNIKKSGIDRAWVHSDDIFVYGMDPTTTKNMEPNRDALEELFTAIMSTGVKHTNPTHGTLAGAIEEWHWVVKEAVKTLNENYWVPAFTLIMGLDNDETPEDGWETIRLINELEREQPNAMFTATPLTFIPIGLLEKSEFYDIGSGSDPTQLGVMYKTWQHNFKYGIKKFMTKTGQRGSFRRTAFNGLARTLGGVPLGAMERFARKRGPKYENVIETIKAKYW
jgi:radical SAM superfamily enzyme YgiQ (UPF0313 family)